MSTTTDDFLKKEFKKFLGNSVDLSCDESEIFFAPFQDVSNVNFFLRKEADESFLGFPSASAPMTVATYLRRPDTVSRARKILTNIEQISRVATLHDLKYGSLLRNLDAHPTVSFQPTEIFV